MNDRIDPSAAAEAPRSRRFSVDLPHRPRRLRQSETMRRHVRETRLHPSQLILPVFVKEGLQEPVEIASMPGVVQHSMDSLRRAAAERSKWPREKIKVCAMAHGLTQNVFALKKHT